VNRILQWCDIIGSLFKYARENQFDDVIKYIKGLNTSSAYGTFMQTIFPGYLYDILAIGNFREYLEEGVINMKCMLMKPKITNKFSALKQAQEVQAEDFDEAGDDAVDVAPAAMQGALNQGNNFIIQPAPPRAQAPQQRRDARLPAPDPELTLNEQIRVDQTNGAYLRMFGRNMTARETAAYVAQIRTGAAAVDAVAQQVRRVRPAAGPQI
jgi:hypothetical protein